MVGKSLINFIRAYKLIFFIFVLCIFVTVISTIYICAVFSANQYKNVSENSAYRLFRISNLSDTLTDEKLKQMRDIRMPISMITMYFDELEIKANYIYPLDSYRFVILGNYFTEDDFVSGSKYIVINNPTEETHVGGTVDIDNIEYVVIGINQSNGYYYNEIPFASVDDYSRITRISLQLNEIPSYEQKKEVLSLLKSLFPTSIVSEPVTVDIIVIASNMTEYLICICIILLAVLNTSYLYQYILEKRQKQFVIMRITGCSKVRYCFIALSEVLLVSGISFILCCFISDIFISHIFSEINGNMQYTLTIHHYFSIFLFYLIIVFTVYWRVIRKFTSRSIKSLF